jgi:hypothetical protein
MRRMALIPSRVFRVNRVAGWSWWFAAQPCPHWKYGREKALRDGAGC